MISPESGSPDDALPNEIASVSPYGRASAVAAAESYPDEMVPSIRYGSAREGALMFSARRAMVPARKPRYAANVLKGPLPAVVRGLGASTRHIPSQTRL